MECFCLAPFLFVSHLFELLERPADQPPLAKSECAAPNGVKMILKVAQPWRRGYPPEFLLEAIGKGAEFTLYRGRQHGSPSPTLAIARSAEQPSPQSLRRLEANIRSQPNSIPSGRPSLWPLLVTKGGQFSY